MRQITKELNWQTVLISTDHSIITIQCTRKGIYKQHLFCNTPFLKLNRLESGRHIPDTYHVQILRMVVITSRQWQRRGENYVLTHHFTLNRLSGYPRTSVWQSPSMKWSTSVAPKHFTKDHTPPWRLQWCNQGEEAYLRSDVRAWRWYFEYLPE